MLFSLLFIYLFCYCFTYGDEEDQLNDIEDLFESDENDFINRYARGGKGGSSTTPGNDTGGGGFTVTEFSCKDLGNTKKSPYVVLLLFRSSGQFLGMGSIVTAKTVLTARWAVENWVQTPNNLLCLAGWMSPWWGNGSQVKRVDEVFINDKDLALLNLKDGFTFNENIKPVVMLDRRVIPPEYKTKFTIDYAVFGIPRSSWDVPGERVAKTCRYVMRVDTMREPATNLGPCKTYYPGFKFVDELHFCTFSNATFVWGCIGSPTMALTKSNELILVAVITKTATLADEDFYHIHTKITPHLIWIRSRSNMEFTLNI